MSFWMMMVVASGAVLALGLLFTLLIVALDVETEEDSPRRREERSWTSVV